MINKGLKLQILRTVCEAKYLNKRIIFRCKTIQNAIEIMREIKKIKLDYNL